MTFVFWQAKNISLAFAERTYKEQNEFDRKRLDQIQKDYSEVKRRPEIVWECRFKEDLKLPENQNFKAKYVDIRDKLRVCPRYSIRGGWSGTFIMKWSKEENPTEVSY